MVGSCWWNSACLCVLWPYNKQWSNGIIMSYIFYTGNATFKQQDPWVFSCKHQPTRNIHKIMGQKQHHHKSCIQLAGSQKETTSARHCSAADFLKTAQKETTLAVPCARKHFDYILVIACNCPKKCDKSTAQRFWTAIVGVMGQQKRSKGTVWISIVWCGNQIRPIFVVRPLH